MPKITYEVYHGPVEMHRQIRIREVFFQFGATRIGKHHEIA
ncbi:MAG: hypothetical protein AUK63_2773, partial [bacterium P3]